MKSIYLTKLKEQKDIRLINHTLSLYPECFRVLKARIIKNEFIYIEKECELHGKFSVKHNWDDPVIYKRMEELKTLKTYEAD